MKNTSCAPAELIGAKATSPSHSELRSEVNACGRADFDESRVMHFALHLCLMNSSFPSVIARQQHAHRSPLVSQINSSFPSVTVNSMHTTLHLNSSFPSVTAKCMHTALHVCLRLTVRFHQLQPTACTPLSTCVSQKCVSCWRTVLERSSFLCAVIRCQTIFHFLLVYSARQ